MTPWDSAQTLTHGGGRRPPAYGEHIATQQARIKRGPGHVPRSSELGRQPEAHSNNGIPHGGLLESSEAMQTEGGPGPVRDSPGTFQERRGGEDPSNRASPLTL